MRAVPCAPVCAPPDSATLAVQVAWPPRPLLVPIRAPESGTEQLTQLGEAPLAHHAEVTGVSQGPPQPCRGNLHQEEEEEKEEGISHGPFFSTRARREKRGEKKGKSGKILESRQPPALSPSRQSRGSRGKPPRSRYLLEATVLDVQLLGVDKVKELPVLLPGDRGTVRAGQPSRSPPAAQGPAPTSQCC